MDIRERASRYVQRMEASVAGSGGHNKLFAAACILVQGFDLDDGSAMEILEADFNSRCSPAWSSREIAHKVRQARLHSSNEAPGYLLKGSDKAARYEAGRGGGGGAKGAAAGAAGVVREKKRLDFEPLSLREMQARGFAPDRAWLRAVSPINPVGVKPERFLDLMFEAGEKVLVFESFTSQGDYGHVAGDPGVSYRLPGRPNVRLDMTPVDLPLSAREGLWFLPSPVDGRWYPTGAVNKQGEPVVSRRSGRSLTVWRHFLLESDEADEGEWLNLVCQLPLPISAMYSSGGRSIHALVRLEARSKGEFDAFRDRVSPFFSRLGADAGAFSGVRLTRLPGVMREGTMRNGVYKRYDKRVLQELLYLNPRPDVRPIKGMVRMR